MPGSEPDLEHEQRRGDHDGSRDGSPPPGPLPPDVAGRRGTGDGLLQLNLGVEVMLSEHVALLGEYSHWFPINDDPGDFYQFVPSNIAGLALRLGRVRP